MCIRDRSVIDHILASLEPDIGYRTSHHEDLNYPPRSRSSK